MPLPAAATEAEYEALPRAHPAYAEAAERIAARHGLEGEHGERDVRGSLPVLAIGAEHVAKLFPPAGSEEPGHEAAVLRHLAGRLPVEVPAVVGQGELDGWSYLLMSRLPGACLADRWDRLGSAERADLATRAGALLAALHALPTEDAPRVFAWEPFLAEQVERCVERQAALGLATPWIDSLAEFVSTSGVLERTPRALLHTELMPDHLLVAERSGRLVLTGMVDFEPSMVGDPEYELASLAAFFFRRDTALWEPFSRGYGRLEPGWRRRALAHACLHRYAHVARYLEWMPPRGARTFDELAELWFGGSGPAAEAPGRIETARLVGERLRGDHLRELARFYADPRVMATLGGVRDPATTAARIADQVAHWDQHGFGIYVLRDRATGAFVGRAGLQRVSGFDREEVEVLYALVPERWNQGLATEVAAELVRIALEDLGSSELVCFTLTANHASRRVMEHVGFRHERAGVRAGAPHVFYRLRRAPAGA